MKNKIALIFLFNILCAGISIAQTPEGAPAFDVYISNETYPSANTFRFDVWIKRTGPGELDIAGLQFGINVNPGFRGQGIVTAQLVSGSSMFVSDQIPAIKDQVRYKDLVTPNTDRIIIAASRFPSCGSGTIIPDTGKSCTAGARFATIELVTSLNGWPKGVKPNLDFNLFPFSKAGVLESKLWYYEHPCPSSSQECTRQATFYDYNDSRAGWSGCAKNPAAPKGNNGK